MSQCWAASLGDCSGKISKEHPISECIFADRMVTIQGPQWPPEGRQAPIRTLSAPVLCEGHNSKLSPLDATAGQLSRALRDLYRLKTTRTIALNGSFYERYCIKVLIGVLSAGWAGGKLGTLDPVFPEIVFGRRRLERGAGLYVVDGFDGRDDDADKVRWALLTDSSAPSQACGIFISVHGLPVVVTTHEGDPSAAFGRMAATPSFDRARQRLVYRSPRIIYAIHEVKVELRVNLAWS